MPERPSLPRRIPRSHPDPSEHAFAGVEEADPLAAQVARAFTAALVPVGDPGDPVGDAAMRSVAQRLAYPKRDAPSGDHPPDDADGGEIGPCYAGENRDSPSLTAHAMVCGALFELGFAPHADVVSRHLEIVRGRIHPGRARSPERPPRTDANAPWLLRTRHVSWVLAMLSEYPRTEIPQDAPDAERRAAKRHREIVRLAYDYLDGDGERVGPPATWLGLRPGSLRWGEFWLPASGRFEHEPNLLNTIYAAIGVARAERNGLALPLRPWSRRRPLPSQVVAELADSIGTRYRRDVRGPRTILTEPRPGPPGGAPGFDSWREPWAMAPSPDDPAGGHVPQVLPAGIVGLLCLFLVEYSAAISAMEGESAGAEYLLRARMLGYDLMSRPEEWTGAIEYYTWQPDPDTRHADYWQVFAYSVCVRAVLETGVVAPDHEVVLRAFDTVALSEARIADAGGDPVTTWRDYGRLYEHLSPDPARWWHAVHLSTDLTATYRDAAGRTRTADPRPVEPALARPSPLSIHSAGMAYAALRRALRRQDPRSMLVARGAKRPAMQHLSPPGDHTAPPPVTSVHLRGPISAPTLALRHGDDDYCTLPISSRSAFVMYAAVRHGAHRVAEIAKLAGIAHAIVGDRAPYEWLAATNSRGAATAGNELNAQLGFTLLERERNEKDANARVAPLPGMSYVLDEVRWPDADGGELTAREMDQLIRSHGWAPGRPPR